MEALRFRFFDVFRSARYAFSLKKISNHFIGLLIAYLAHEILVYLSLLVVDMNLVSDFWSTYGLRPVFPSEMGNLPSITQLAISLSVLVLFISFFVTSTMVSKITLEQLKNNPFYSIGEAKSFVEKRWLSVFGTMIGILVIFLVMLAPPVLIGLLGRVPFIGQYTTMFSSFLLPIAFVVGLLAIYQILALFASLLFAPSVVAVADSDSFETIYQLYSMIWNRPWHLVLYSDLLLLVKVISVPIWAGFCLVGYTIILLPIRLLLPVDMAQIMGQADVISGGVVSIITNLGLNANWEYVFETSDIESFPLQVAGTLMGFTAMFILGLVISYLFSIASVGNTIIYTILRYQIHDENMLETEEQQPVETQDHDLSDEAMTASDRLQEQEGASDREVEDHNQPITRSIQTKSEEE